MGRGYGEGLGALEMWLDMAGLDWHEEEGCRGGMEEVEEWGG